ncbi:TolC family protein [Sulfurovum sp.]|uniref:TolC family protein n=1 Tax=Sulfurovum sp. TaxID=1969726 RepID=UPI002867EAA6|nr:TolC family protein [Sulfurovum sp.]
MRTFFLLFITSISLWSLSIDEAIERAMTHSPAIERAQSNMRYAASNELGAQAAFHPTLDAGYQWRDVDKTTAFSYSPAYNYNLTAKYNLFNGFADKATVNARELETASQRLLLRAKQEDVALDVVGAYTTYLKAKKAVQTQKDELSSLNRSYNDTKTRYEQGMIAKNELLLIDVDRLRAEQALVSAKSDIIRARDNLGRVIGVSLDRDESVNEISKKVNLVENIDILLERTIKNRSELRALYKQKAALEEEYTVATGNFYPSVDLQGEYMVNDKSLQFGGSTVQHKDQFATTVNVSWNLYNGRSDEALRIGALEKVSGIDADIKAMKMDLQYQIIDAYEAYRTAKSAQDVARRAKESAEENFRITNDRYEYGQVDTLTLLKTQSDLTAARNANNNAYYNLYMALASVKRVSGE